MNATNGRHTKWIRIFVILGAVMAACGHRTSTDELVAANSRVLEQSEDGALAGSDGPVDVEVRVGDDGSGAPGGATDTGGSAAATGGGGTTGGSAGSVPAGDTSGSVGTPGETGPIIIGSVGNYSGIAGPPLAPMVRAVQVWAEYVNSKGGLFGREVRMIVVDDRGDPAQHLAALRDLVENRHVVAFVEIAAALTKSAGRQYIESVSIPVIGTDCSTVTEFESPMYFPQCERVTDFFQSVVQAGVEFGGTGPDFGFISCLEAQTCADGRKWLISDGLANRAGANVVYNGQVSTAQPDFTSECRQASAAGAGFVSVLLDPTAVIRFGQSCARQGYNPLYVQGSATSFYNTKDQPGLANVMVVSGAFNFVGTETPARKEFHDVMKSFYGRSPGPAEALGWAAAKLFELVATRAAATSQSLTPETIIAALHTVSNETLGGLTVPLTFPKGGPAANATCAFAARVEDGEWVTVNNSEPICH